MTDLTHCPGCEISFKAFRSGATFNAVAQKLYPSLPKAKWLKPYTRKNVLSKLKSLKRTAWARHLQECAESMESQPEPEQDRPGESPFPPHRRCHECGRSYDESPHTCSLAVCDECLGAKP